MQNLWVQLNLAGSRSLLIGANYKPHELDEESFEEINKSLDLVKKSNSTIYLLTRGFQPSPRLTG